MPFNKHNVHSPLSFEHYGCDRIANTHPSLANNARTTAAIQNVCPMFLIPMRITIPAKIDVALTCSCVCYIPLLCSFTFVCGGMSPQNPMSHAGPLEVCHTLKSTYSHSLKPSCFAQSFGNQQNVKPVLEATERNANTRLTYARQRFFTTRSTRSTPQTPCGSDEPHHQN